MDAVDPDRFRTLCDIPRVHAEARPDAVALSFEGRDTSHAAFNRYTDKVAAALVSAGLGPGDRVCHVGKNSDHYFELVFGAAKAGCVTAPIGWRLASQEIAYAVNDADAKILFYGAELAEGVESLRGALTSVRDFIPLADFARWRDAAAPAPARDGSPDDVAVQLYTSGTTGRPKGVMLTHANLLAARRVAHGAGMEWSRWTPEDVSLVAMPNAHIAGTGLGILGLYHGARSVILREFDPERVLDAIEGFGVSRLFLVPAALQMVVRHPRARGIDYSRLRHVLYGASPIPLDLLRECMEVFGCEFCQQYGMTETTGTIVYLPPEDHDPAGNTRMRGAGLPLPGVEIKVVGADGATLPPNTVGEIVTRSALNMSGYWRLADATHNTIDAQGWLRTGDAGYLDEDGYLYIHDRIKDMIVSGAENIYPAEVENAIYGHPDVADVAVIGVPDDTWGEAVKAIVVAKPGAAPDAESIIAFARTRIARFKAPKSIDFVAALPRNASGKILRRALREPYWAGRERRVN